MVKCHSHISWDVKIARTLISLTGMLHIPDIDYNKVVPMIPMYSLFIGLCLQGRIQVQEFKQKLGAIPIKKMKFR